MSGTSGNQRVLSLVNTMDGVEVQAKLLYFFHNNFGNMRLGVVMLKLYFTTEKLVFNEFSVPFVYLSTVPISVYCGFLRKQLSIYNAFYTLPNAKHPFWGYKQVLELVLLLDLVLTTEISFTDTTSHLQLPNY